MKKIILICAVALVGCSQSKVIKIEKLPSNECIYTVTDTVNYTFVDSCGAYKIGQTVK